MSVRETGLRIGFIPLCAATALIVAVDKGFAAAEVLDAELVREVSWVRGTLPNYCAAQKCCKLHPVSSGLRRVGFAPRPPGLLTI
jgi:hypothetical protein